MLIACATCSQAMAQMAPGMPSPLGPPAAAPQGGAVQALFVSPAGGGQQSPYVDAYGNPVIVPASYNGPNYGEPYPGECGPCADPYCPPMGTYPPFSEDMMDVIGTPGINSEQCGPHYFDFRAEAVYMKPDQTFGQAVDFTSFNVSGPIVLASNQLDYDWEPGFRVLGRYDLGPLSVLEFGYMGIYAWDTASSFTDPNPVDPAGGPDGSPAGRIRFSLGRPDADHPSPFASLGSYAGRDLSGRAGLVLQVRSDDTSRLWLQVRDRNPDGYDGVEIWAASIKTTPVWRSVTVPFDTLVSTDPGTDGTLDLDRIEAIVFLADLGSHPPGATREFWIDNLGVY